MTSKILALVVTMTLVALSAQFVFDDGCKDCQIRDCYWIGTERHSEDSAENACASHGASLAVIPDEQIYEKVLSDARMKFSDSVSDIFVRTGMHYLAEPCNGSVEQPDAYVKWAFAEPVIQPGMTGIGLRISYDASSEANGMFTDYPRDGLDGYLCYRGP